MLKESQASFLKESSSNDVKHSMEDVNDVIGLFERKLEKFNKDERSAIDKENYLELKKAKENQMEALTKIINGYNTKLNLLKSQQIDLQEEIDDIAANGVDVFKNQEMDEFANDSFEKGWGLKIETPNTSTSVIKQADHNNYKIVATNIQGLTPEMLLMLPDLKIGGEGKVKVYSKREDGSGYENIKNFTMQNITGLIKNPK